MATDGASLTKNSKTFERKLMGVRSPFPFPSTYPNSRSPCRKEASQLISRSAEPPVR